jgi:hypothetical protein
MQLNTIVAAAAVRSRCFTSFFHVHATLNFASRRFLLSLSRNLGKYSLLFIITQYRHVLSLPSPATFDHRIRQTALAEEQLVCTAKLVQGEVAAILGKVLGQCVGLLLPHAS